LIPPKQTDTPLKPDPRAIFGTRFNNNMNFVSYVNHPTIYSIYNIIGKHSITLLPLMGIQKTIK